MLRPALFVDRDGTLIEETDYLVDASQIRLFPGSADALRVAREAGFLVVIITNQSAVARGLLSLSQLEAIHHCLTDLLEKERAPIDAVYACPHHPEHSAKPADRDCPCRKPKPGLLFAAAQELSIDLTKSFLVGDKISDIEAGHRAGCKSVLVLTGYGSSELSQLRESQSQSEQETKPDLGRPDFVAKNLSAAVDWVLGDQT